jgi:hypothetical protein
LLNQPGDKFTVGGAVLDAGQFGNYFAGYVTMARFGESGVAAAAAAGQFDNMAGWLRGGDPTVFDPPIDRRLILIGASNAVQDYKLTCNLCAGGKP